MSLNLHPMVNVAVKAARAAGSLINRAALDIESVRVSQKKANDFVTDFDQFVGFLAGFRTPGCLGPWLGGVVGATLTVWVTFIPCFLWILAGAPYVDALRGNRALSGALAAITAAVVGVIFNLSVWFALHVLFTRVAETRMGILHLTIPDPASLDPLSLVLALSAAFAMLRLHLGMIPTLVACGTVGVMWRLLLLP
jgi:chromate transporter